MIYTPELALLKMKAEALENILSIIEVKNDAIARYSKEEDEDGWYKGQIANLQLEVLALESITKTITK